MSSGSILLQQLRSRQSSSSSSIQKTGNSDGKNENRDIKSSSRDVDGTAATPTNLSVAEVSQPAVLAIAATKKKKKKSLPAPGSLLIVTSLIKDGELYWRLKQ